METKNEGLLTSLARTVGNTAGVIVAKTAQLKDEVTKIGSPSVGLLAKKTTKKKTAKKVSAKKVAAKPKTVRASGKKKSARKTSARARSGKRK